MRLPNSNQMRELDRRTIEEIGVPGVVLMEHAGSAATSVLLCRWPAARRRPVLIVAGPGNNGGDGLVVARRLRQAGGEPRIILLTDPARLTGDAAVNLAIVRALGLPLWPATDEKTLAAAWEAAGEPAVVVDGIFGTGLTRELTGRFAAAVARINAMAAPCLALDIASGVDSDTGRVLGTAVRAQCTVTFGLPKPGHYLAAGAEHTGDLEVADIGIPPAVVAAAAIPTELLTPDTVAALLPPRPATAHKGTTGHLLIVAGANGKTGAAILAGRGGLHGGAGLVTLALPADLVPIVATALPEVMTVPLEASRGRLDIASRDELNEALAGKRALALGPGMGTAPATAQLVLHLYREARLPMVVDADGLNILAGHPGGAGGAPAPRILTPHPGEMARLAGCTTGEVQADRLAVARDFARHHGVVVVLKGNGTVIAAPDGRAAVNPTGNPGMAGPGMGDVLTGLLGALLAQGLPPWDAARAGVYLHGLAADRLAAVTPAGYTAGDVARALPAARAQCTSTDPTNPEGVPEPC